MTSSLAHLLNQAPEFHTGLVELDAQAFDHPPLLADAISQHALPPERADQGAVLDEIAALDALSEAWERTFGGVWLPPSK